MTAAECVNKVNCRGVIGLIGSLNAAFCHHGVSIAHTKLGNDHNVSTCFVCFDRSRCTGTAATDDENVGFVVRLIEIYAVSSNAAVSLQKCCKFFRNLIALVGTDGKSCKFVYLIVGMEGSEYVFLLLCCHTDRFKSDIFLSCRFNEGERILKLFRIHLFFLLTFRYRGCCRVLSSQQ